MFRRSGRRSVLVASLLLGALLLLAGGSVALAAPAGPQAATGDTFSVLLKADGTLWSWGSNQHGQLGLGPGVYSRRTATRVGSASDWSQIVAGNLHVLALKSDGTLWAWGFGADGRLGLGDDTSDRLVPTQVGAADDWAYVAAGLRYSFAVKSDGTLWAWGPNNEGQLGTGDTETRFVPTQVGSDSDWRVVDGGGTYQSAFAAALKTDGSLWTWGGNNHGQLGQGDKVDRLLPLQVGDDADWAGICLSDADVEAFKDDGTLWVWGSNEVGQIGLGAGAAADVMIPTLLEGDWAVAASGDNSTFAIKGDGTLWAWGDNTYGQAAQSSLDQTLYRAPVQVGDQGGWVDVFSGYDHVLALRSDQSLWAWGKNDSLQLGLGDDVQRTAPALVSYLDDVTAPSILDLVSSSHPLETDWYSDPLPAFTWTSSEDGSGVVGYARDFNQSAVHVPDPVWEQSGTQWAVPAPVSGPRPDGVWYVHVRAVDGAGNWGGTVSRAVKIDTTGPVLGDDASAGWSGQPVVVRFTATDALSGMAGDLQYKLPGGDWTTGTEATVSGEGANAVAYRASDVAGNVAEKTVTVRIDKTPPVTTHTAPSAWVRGPVTVRLTRSDSGSGVDFTEYKLDGGAWTRGSQPQVSGNGIHTLVYRSTDVVGNREADESVTVRIDRLRPVTRAPKAASVVRGRTATLQYRVNDARPGSATAKVTIRVKTLGGTTVKTITVEKAKLNTLLRASFRCKLAKRTYKFFVYATDSAGNTQSKVGSNRLTVR